ncbi:MAG TPA: adenylate/guanylate cyclase domain-containing protein [Acidimicrobiia bacterium]
MTAGDQLLDRARKALDQHAWSEAYDLFRAADVASPLGPEDLDRLGHAAYWLGRMDDCIDARERAYATYMAAGENTRAGRVALRLAEDHFHRLSGSVGRGWLARANRLLGESPDSPEYGWLARANAVIAFERRGVPEEALAWAQTAFDRGFRDGDQDLQALSLHDQGRALVALGRTDEGMVLMEEAMVAAVGGELEAEVTGRIYCNMIDICERLADYGRAAEWDEAARRWCERVGNDSGFPGICRVHRAGIMRHRGRWHEAEREAERAVGELSDFLDIAGIGFCEIGEIRLRTGDLEGAEAAFRQANELGHPPEPGLALLHLANGDVEGARQLIGGALADGSLMDLERAKLLPAWTEIALALGDQESAEAAAGELARIASESGSEGLQAAASQAAGAVALDRGDLPLAVEHTTRAVRLWSDIDLPYEAARARLQLGLAYRAQNAGELARMEIEGAGRVFERLGAALDLMRVRELEEVKEKTRSVRVMMFTDIVGSTDLIDTIGDEAWSDLVAWHDRVLRSIFSAHQGRELQHAGDGFFVVFPDAPGAVDAAIEIQQTLRRHRRDAGFAPGVRIGIHAAEVTETAESVQGLEVHRAARIAALAGAGEILTSEEVARGFAPDRRISNPRSVVVKGISQPVAVVSVEW